MPIKPNEERVNELVTEITGDLSDKFNDYPSVDKRDKIKKRDHQITYIIRQLAIERAINEILKERICQTSKK